MKTLKNTICALFALLALSLPVFAQNGAMACGAFAVVYILILLFMLAVGIGITVFIIKWIKKDATTRGMPNADSIKWLGLLGLLGLIIYLIMRPSGPMPPSAPPQNNQWGG
jgi:NADH:ubiquinone oxidoreductase subunit 6 (subunit J)